MPTFADALGVLYLRPLEKTVNSPNRPVEIKLFNLKKN